MADVLDYSSGRPRATVVRAAGYAGAVRYAGTRGHGKNLTQSEAQDYQAAGLPLSFVYESTAGWVLGGREAGAAAARAAMADLVGIGYDRSEIRCVYFAADIDITTPGQMVLLGGCLDGAAAVMGLERTGVYGEHDVIEAMLRGGRATWGWQTRAWSGGQVSGRAHLLQQIGAVRVDGVECDRNTVLKPDWGQTPGPKGVINVADAESLAAQLATVLKSVQDTNRLLSVGDAPDSAKNPDGSPVDRGGHPFNLEAVRKVLNGQAEQISALDSKLEGIKVQLQQALAAGGDPAAVAAVVREVLGTARFTFPAGS